MSRVIFGPVNSRRFGKSLGVDLSPEFKQCNFDCLYCELQGAKPVGTQIDIVPLAEVIKEIDSALEKYTDIDYITLTANGEPTLYPHLEELINFLQPKKEKVLILTNSSTINDPKISHSLQKLDCVKLSLDCISSKCFKKVDRPFKSIDINTIINGIIQFSKKYKGELLIEILFVKGINDSDEEIKLLNDTLCKFKAKRIDIGTIDRPPAYKAQALTYEELFTISQKFNPTLPINITTKAKQTSSPQSYTQDEIYNTLSKRPLTPQDVEVLFDEESKKNLQILQEKKKIVLQEGFFKSIL